MGHSMKSLALCVPSMIAKSIFSAKVCCFKSFLSAMNKEGNSGIACQQELMMNQAKGFCILIVAGTCGLSSAVLARYSTRIHHARPGVCGRETYMPPCCTLL